jgi:hypothetical protein
VLVLIVAAFVLLICLLVAADRLTKVFKRGMRRREANQRLGAAVAQGKAKAERRQAAEQVGGALTSVMPTIHDIETRHVE